MSPREFVQYKHSWTPSLKILTQLVWVGLCIYSSTSVDSVTQFWGPGFHLQGKRGLTDRLVGDPSL